MASTGSVPRFSSRCGVVESNKTVSDLFAPVTGRVTAVNHLLRDEPERVNRDPYGDGWLLRVRGRDWEGEREELLHGEGHVRAWIGAELQAMRERR